MSDSPKLSLPYIQASQAQKHVTHNEGLQMLDVIVQANAIDRDLTVPPASPAEGDVYIVAAGGTGAWAERDNQLAAWQSGAWQFHAPDHGWRVWVNDENILLAWGGAGWINASGTNTDLNPATGGMVGINTTADATNRLSVSSPATLLNNEGAGHQLKINKNAATDTASLLFQTNWSGRAEMGLAGNNNFSVKTSNGTNWFSALECSSANGRVSLPSGVSGHIPVFDTGRSVFIGEGAGSNDDLTYNNSTFVGFFAGQANTTGGNNSATGMNALRSNTIGGNNSAIGVSALRANITGTSNSAVGMSALRSNTTGANNSATGVNALRYNTTGASNSATGLNALRANTIGSRNTAIGADAGRFTAAGGANQTSSNGVYLGARVRSGANGNYNEIVIGASARGRGSNTITLGSAAITGAHVQVAWTIVSDARDKADISPVKHGLDFIGKINPVEFRYTKTRGGLGAGPLRYGFLAQDVLQAEGDNPVIVDATDPEELKLNETALISVLVNAVQELTARVKELENA